MYQTTAKQTQIITDYLGHATWTGHARRRYVWVPLGARSYYFYFDEQDQLQRVEVDGDTPETA